jgi:bifunctional non-homologous end joining protein LigD
MTTKTQNPSTTLYYKDGNSDKVYSVAVVPSGNGFVVNFAFGRRGTTLQTGTKTASAGDFDAAQKIYDKLIREKTAKGYTPGEDGTPYRPTKRLARVRPARRISGKVGERSRGIAGARPESMRL